MVTVYQKARSRTESYLYDAMGNRTEERLYTHIHQDGMGREKVYDYEYYQNSNRLKKKERRDGSERYEYEYDANGNLTVKIVTKGEKIDRWEYAYDLFNQLEQVKKNGEIVSTYIYDPNGFRVEKVGSKGKIHYVPLLNGEIGYRKEFATNAEYSFIYVGIQHLARVNGVIGGSGKKFYYHNDHLGSALAITDEYGNKVVERDFTPFGERINTDVYDDEPRDIEEDESGFTGKDWDEDVGLYYYNARWYDPTVGRFISEDSVADPANPNEFVYVANNPVNNIDPSGHFSVSLQSGLGLVGAIINAAALLTDDENLDNLATAFDLFVCVYSLFTPLQKVEGIKDEANNGEKLSDSTIYGDKLLKIDTSKAINEIQEEMDLFKEFDENDMRKAVERMNGKGEDIKDLTKFKNKPSKSKGSPKTTSSSSDTKVTKNTPPPKESGYEPPKGGPKKTKTKDGKTGWVDKYGNVWVPVPDGSPQAHGGGHWDVQYPNGGYDNVYPDGKVRPGSGPKGKYSPSGARIDTGDVVEAAKGATAISVGVYVVKEILKVLYTIFTKQPAPQF